MRRAALISLYIAVVLLMTVPPLFALYLSKICMNPTGAACRSVTAADWLTGELAGIWIPPFVIALLLIWVITRLHRAGW